LKRSGKHARLGRSAGVRSLRQSAFVLFCLLAFGLQTFTAQTHIHVPGGADDLRLGGAGSYSSKDQAGTKGHPAPARDSRENCPLCQVAVHAGAFLTPSIWILEIPTHIAASSTLGERTDRMIDPASYIWRSRAPPQA
jgi:hypothetical protein